MTHFALCLVAKLLPPPQFGLAQIWAHMTPDQVKLAVEVKVDGLTAAAVAERNGVSRATVNRATAILRKTLDRFGMTLPKPTRANSRHVRQIPEHVAREL